jgi:hypothetical protein
MLIVVFCSPWGDKDEIHKLTLKTMALTVSLPNFFFHLTTGYSILRAKGVPVGKIDYLDSFVGL